jgi:hypothetical protein
MPFMQREWVGVKMKDIKTFLSGVCVLFLTTILFLFSVKWWATYLITTIFLLLSLSLIQLGWFGKSFLGDNK